MSVLAALFAPAQAVAADGDDPLIVVTGSAVVPEDGSFDGLFVVDADTRIEGTVTSDAIVIAGETTVSGTVEGDLTAVSGPVRLLPGAEVTGDLIYGDERPEVAPSATVGGEIVDEGWDDAADVFPEAFPLLAGIALWIAFTVSALVLGILLIAFAPRAADAAARRAAEEPWMAVGLGAGAFIALPLIGFAAAFTLVGIPLAIAVLLALLPLAALAYVTTAWIIGRRMLGEDKDRFLSFLAGLAVLRVIAIIPVLGLIAWFVAVIFGLGALVLAAHRTRSGPEDYSVAEPSAAA